MNERMGKGRQLGYKMSNESKERISATKAINRENQPEKQTTITISVSLKNRLEIVAAIEHCTVREWIEKRVTEVWPKRWLKKF